MHKKLPLKILDLFGTSCFLTKFVQLFFYILILICTLSCKFFDDSHGSSSSSLFWGGSCDWLILGYMDADNNLNDSLYIDLINEQFGLANLSDSASVKILTLWDGYTSGHHNHPKGALYELGPIDRNSYNSGLSNSGFIMSSATRDLSAYAGNWITEPDMSDALTLKKFLSFAAMNYSAKNVVLLLSDHGAGTEFEAVSGGYGGRRSLASDETNGGNKLLTATDVKDAITSSGIHVNVIWMDCCLQGSVETTYILRGTADYLVSSANSSYSNNHAAIVSGINASTTPLSFATSVVQAYADTHKDGIIQMQDGEKRASFDTMPTQSAYSLDTGKQEALCSAISTLADALINEGKTVYDLYLKQDYVLNVYKGMAFPGTFAYLNDIGYLCKNLKNNSNSSVSSAANSVLRALDSVIVSSWLGRTESESRNYYKKNVTGIPSTVLSSSDGTFGLTIATQCDTNPLTGKEYSSFPLYLKYADVTGYSRSWGDLMQKWHTGEY